MGKNERYKRGRISLILMVLLLSSACGIVQFKSGTITITNAFTTSGIDSSGQPLAPATEFHTKTSRIYCIVSVDSPSLVPVGVRWFFENELFYDQVIRTDRSAPLAMFIEPLPGESFPVGSYRAEVYLVKEAVRVLDFIVVP